ncbi:MAG TPA: VOC family protein [Actinotalea sp.]|nr:VOC family protein [Actinotalea sp.]
MTAPYPMLWFASEAEEAVELYTSLIPGSEVLRVQRFPEGTPGATPGEPMTITFTLGGTTYAALNGGPHEAFNDSISLVLECAGQDELDRMWQGLLDGGGEPSQCGWLRDRYGVRWQVVPDNLYELLSKPAAVIAMLSMVKLDIAGLEAAGRS